MAEKWSPSAERDPHLPREPFHGPVLTGLAMQQRERRADVTIAQARQPARAAGGQRFDMPPHGLDERKLCHPREHCGGTGPRRIREREREAQRLAHPGEGGGAPQGEG